MDGQVELGRGQRAVFMIRFVLVAYLRHGPSDMLNRLGEAGLDSLRRTAAGRGALASLFEQAGDRVSAQRELDGLMHDGAVAVPYTSIWLAELCTLADVVVRLDAVEHAKTLYALLAPHADRLPFAPWNALPGAPVSLALAMLATTMGDLAGAESWFQRAFAHCKLLASPFLRAYTQVESLRLLAKRGDDTLLPVARSVEAFALRHDLGLFAQRARAVLSAPAPRVRTVLGRDRMRVVASTRDERSRPR